MEIRGDGEGELYREGEMYRERATLRETQEKSKHQRERAKLC